MTGPVLVTGATGNVGREVALALRARGVPFVAAGTDPARVRRALGDDVAAVALDFRRPETYDGAVRGMRGLFLLRPPPIANVRETLNVLVDRARAAGVEHIVFLSVAGADRQRWVPHHKVERHLLDRGGAATILRPGFFAQNLGDAYREDIRGRSELYVPAGTGRVAFIDVRDIAEVAAQAFGDPARRGQQYTLTGPAAVSFTDVAAVLTAALGRPCRYRAASIPGYAAHLRRRGLPWGQVAIQTLLHVGLRVGHGAAVDPTLARLLGRRPRGIEDYVRDHVALWQG
ncbi:MAG TPA: NAD(P)H-binding protein [Polyangia bacterium]|jgi:uncharacterized protein YbjT (DUF2867 family)